MSLPYTFFDDLAEINTRRDNPVFDPNTGLSREILLSRVLELAGDESRSRVIRKAEIVAFILDNARLEISPFDLFCDRLDREGIMEEVNKKWSKILIEKGGADLIETNDGEPCGAYDGNADFGHTCPDYNSILTLGIPGLISRLESSLESATDECREFYETSLTAYKAFRRLLLRFADAYEKQASVSPIAAAVSENCRFLADNKPETLLQALELIAIYYRTQHHVEGTITRSLGRLDVLIEPYYKEGSESDEILRYFLNRMNDRFFSANIPFTIGGEDVAKNRNIERLDLRILEIYESLNIPSPKIQIRVGKNTPRSIVSKACQMIKSGTNSIVFCNDRTVIDSFLKNGHTAEDAMNYVMIGCYEPSTMGSEVSCTCAGNVVLPKAVECALNGGRDMISGKLVGLACPDSFESFNDFYGEVKRQAEYFADQSMRRIRAKETFMMEISPSPLFSGSMQCCIDSGTDAYAGGAKYNFTSVNVFGIGTAVDSIFAVKKLVFDDGAVSITELREILKNNWEGNEKLRLTAKNKCLKYGDGVAEADHLAADLMSNTVNRINGSPNNRNGRFRAGAFSVDARIPYGRRCAASADGRPAGEPLSKNMSPSDGTGKNGVTAMIGSACAIDYSEISNGTVLDVVLHRSAVSGTDGLTAMEGLVYSFLDKGGFAIQINVLDPAVLREAQAMPEKHKNLQVRLCGWNVLFVNLKKQEQDEFIAMSDA